jgi:putative pyruvate formate lyase activating enzyme
MPYEPVYLNLKRSGELVDRVAAALELLRSCTACPRLCRVNRLAGERAVCRIGRYSIVSSYFAHMGEEDCLRGWHGSGTIFFANCNLKCIFCQNYDISQLGQGRTTRAEELAHMMLELQEKGCHNINFVTPEHCVPQILEALPQAIERGLRLPLVYNTSAYDSIESLRLLEGVIDIYMPDFKIWDSEAARRLLKAEDYPETARQAIREMHRQVGDLTLDENGLATRGLLVRHLVMPDNLAGTSEIARFLAEEISVHTYVNVMDQYRPAWKSNRYPEVNRRITGTEYRRALAEFETAGIRRLDRRGV